MSPIDYERLPPSSFCPLDPSFFSQKWSIYILRLSVRPSVRQEEPTDLPTVATIGIR